MESAFSYAEITGRKIEYMTDQLTPQSQNQRPLKYAASPSRTSARNIWALCIGLVVITAITLVLLFLLALATKNSELYEQYYPWLLGVNIFVAFILLLTFVWGVWRLVQRLRKGKFGSRLLINLAGIFCLVGILPGLLIYAISYQFVSRSIENWFDVRVEGALTAGVGLAQTSLDAWLSNTTARARAAADQLSQSSEIGLGTTLEQVMAQIGGTDAVLWDANMRVIATAGASRFSLFPERPSAEAIRVARNQREWASLEGMDQAEAGNSDAVRVNALVQLGESRLGLTGDQVRFLRVSVPVPSAIVADAFAVQEANREYRQRALGREGLRRMYIGTLTLSLFLAVFSAIVVAIVLGNRLLRPLLILAEGVREVSAGDLSPKLESTSNDELGGLTRAFANMTHQLAAAQQAEKSSARALEAARAHVQTILDNLTAGVIVLNGKDSGCIISSNPGATRVLRAPLAAYEGQSLATVPGLEDFALAVQQRFAAFLDGQRIHSGDHWQHSFELHASPESAAPSSEQDVGITIVARGALLPDGNHLLVLDDISEVVSAQRAQAWGEVARRLAHEIKNPLTPIQLSAERLEMKLHDKLVGADQAMLAKSVKTIVAQVDALKRMVNEFRDYARLPSANLQPLDINALVRDVLHLYGTENAEFVVQAQLDERCPAIKGDALQLGQVIHNLLQNAQDSSVQAAEQSGTLPEPVKIITHWSQSQKRVRLTVEDNGTGFPAKILQRVFEPYVTTKAKGTGLGLAVVKKISEEHGAIIELDNRLVEGEIKGARVSLLFLPVESV